MDLKNGARIIMKNIGRSGIHNGLFGNPFKVWDYGSASATLPHYRKYLRKRIATDPSFANHMLELKGEKLFCPGCGVGSPTCHAGILEDELTIFMILGSIMEVEKWCWNTFRYSR